MLDFLSQFDMATWVSTIGYAGLILIVFLETGLFLGFFLPGDSLLFVAGMLAAKGLFDITVLIMALTVTAFAGYTVGYWFGKKLGHWLLARKDSIFFRKHYLQKARNFYDRHGGKALVLGRLVPIVRTFVPIVAGMAEMPQKQYVIYNIIGAIVWGTGITLLGYWLGGILPDASKYLLPMVCLIVILSILPGVIHYLKERKSR